MDGHIVTTALAFVEVKNREISYFLPMSLHPVLV